MDSIIEAVFQHAQEQPERAAIFFEGRAISYGQLYADIERFAYALKAWGLQSGDRVALLLDNCPEFVIAYFGIQLAGGIVVLINTQYRQVELSHILNDAGVRLCVTNLAGSHEVLRLDIASLAMLISVSSQKDALPVTSAVASITFADFIAAGSRDTLRTAQEPLALPTASAPALIGYTSGTTGRSKGALLTQQNLLSNIVAVTTAWHWTDQDRLLLALPLFHTHGLMVGMHGTLFTGASVVLRRKFDAIDILTTLRTDPGITLFFGVPTMYVRLLAEAERVGAPTQRLRLFVSGSAPLSTQVFENFARVFGQTILERYGMTETIMNLTNPYVGERRAGTVGKPFPGQEARVVDSSTRQPLSAHAIGEIEVRGPHVFAGYWQRPDATAEAFNSAGWFATGDLGWFSDDGYYTITGRARELIISGGYNIYPREVEDVLEAFPSVAEAAVVGMPDSDLGEQVVAVIVPVAGQDLDASAIIAFCREQLASYKKPRQIVFVEVLPRNALGKVQKHLLIAQLKSASA
jgi:malonyl-CoA/methylmalonyl-CoA synthetase